MHMGLTIPGWFCLALSAVGSLYVLAAAIRTAAFLAEPVKLSGNFPPVTILKPLFGSEPGLKENLRTFCMQDYPAPVQIVFGVHEAGDAAAPIVEELKREYPNIEIVLAVESVVAGSNKKVSNLISMRRYARHEFLVLSDSDIAVRPDYLKRVTTALAGRAVGAVTCPYIGMPRAGFVSVLSAMGITYQFLPNAVMGYSLGMAQPCFGSTIALRAETLRQAGGFEALADVLADDYELGRLVAGLGLRVAMPPLLVEHSCTETSWGEFFRHEVRWGRTIRGVDPKGYFGSIVTFAVPMGLLAAFLPGPGAWGVGMLILALLSRLFLKARLDRIMGSPRGPDWLLPLRDLVSFAVYAVSLWGRRVQWRGAELRVNAGGVLTNK